MKRIITNLIVFVLLAFSTIQAQTVFTVTKTSDPDPFIYSSNPDDPEIEGTLQWAIRKANETAGPCIIVFNIPGSGQQVIYLNYELPLITKEVTIDGTTQPGYAFGNPTVKVDGQGLLNSGFQNYNSPLIIKGLQISNFQYHGIYLYNGDYSFVLENVFTGIINPDEVSATMGIRFVMSDNSTIKGNIFGLDPENNIGQEIESYGILFQASYYGLVGGTGFHEANTITNCNSRGVFLDKSQFIKISGNSIYNNPIAIFLGASSNQFIQPPVINSYVDGTLSGVAVPNSFIEIFGSIGNENANEYITTTTSNASGYWTTSISVNSFNYCIATVTNETNNTSNLSNAVFSQIPTV